ncbi:hypothetical protein HK104_003041, partial [Borealophlyctis nickersoniae]
MSTTSANPNVADNIRNVERVLDGVLSEKGLSTRLRYLSSCDAPTLRHVAMALCSRLDGPPVTDDAKETRKTSDLLFLTASSLARARVVQPTPIGAATGVPEDEGHLQRATCLRICQKLATLCAHQRPSQDFSTIELDLVKDIPTRLYALRTLSNLLKPSSHTVKNPAFASSAVAAHLMRPDPAAGEALVRALISSLNLDYDSRFYALRVLIGLTKKYQSAVETVLESEPTSFMNALGVGPVVVLNEKLGNDRFIPLDDVYLQVVLLADILLKGKSTLRLSEPDGRLMDCIMVGIDAVVGQLGRGREPSTVEDTESSPEPPHVRPPNFTKFLKSGLDALSILIERQPLLRDQFMEGRGVWAMLTLLCDFTESLASWSNGATRLGDEIAHIMRSLCQILWIVCKPSDAVSQPDQEAIFKAVGEFGLLLADGTSEDDDPTEGFSKTDWIAAARPSLLRPLLDLLLWCGRQCLDKIDLLPHTLVRLYLLVNTPEYTRQHSHLKIPMLKGKLLRVLTFVVSDSKGLESFAALPNSELRKFCEDIRKNIGSGFASGALDDSESDTSDGVTSPCLGTRSLRLMSLMLRDWRCRKVATDEGLLETLLKPGNINSILNAAVTPHVKERADLLFACIDAVAVDSNIRFRMRDGRFWPEPTPDGEDAEEEGGSIPIPSVHPPHPPASFHIVHFLVVLMLRASAPFLTSNSNTASSQMEHFGAVTLWTLRFLGKHYGHDPTALKMLSLLPVASLDEHRNVADLAYTFEKSGARYLSVIPTLLRLLSAENEALADNSLDLDFDAVETSPMPSIRIAAAGLLDALTRVTFIQEHMLRFNWLKDLAKLVTKVPPDISAILMKSLPRILINPETRMESISRLGFSVVFSALHDAKMYQDLKHTVNTLQFNKESMIPPLLRIFDYSEFAESSSTGFQTMTNANVMRDKAAIAMAYSAPASLLRQALSGPGVVPPGEPDPTEAARVLSTLYTMVFSHGDAQQEPDDSGSGSPDIMWWRKRRRHYGARALQHLAWVLENVLEPFGPVGVDWGDRGADDGGGLLIDALFECDDDGGGNNGTDSDPVSFAFPDDPHHPHPSALSCSAAAMASLSPALRAMFYGMYAESFSDTVAIHQMEYETWKLIVSYARLTTDGLLPPTAVHRPRPIRDFSLARTRRILLLAQCADRFLISLLRKTCLEWLLASSCHAVRTRQGEKALVIRKWLEEEALGGA